nr:extracellular solute-binding protein [Leifsonia xyli]
MAALALGLAGCAPGSGSTSAEESGDVTLAVWSWRPEDKAAYTRIFAEYEKRHPGVTVKFSAFKNTEYPQVLTTGLTGSGGPDIAQVQAYGKLQPYVDGGNLVALDGKIAGLKDIDEAALAGATGKQDGKVYGVPFAMQTLQTFYNKDIFAKHKLSAPTTWDEFVRVDATLKQNGVTPMAVGGKDTWTLPILHDTLAAAVYGGSAFQKEVVSGATTFQDPAYVKGIQTVASLQDDLPKDVVGVSYTDAQSLFLAGQAGMYPGGSFELGFFTAQNPNLKLGVFAVPPSPGPVSETALTPGYADGSSRWCPAGRGCRS